MQLISHRMLVSALPHEAPQDSIRARQTEEAMSEVTAPLQVLPGRDLSEIMDRDETAFRSLRKEYRSSEA